MNTAVLQSERIQAIERAERAKKIHYTKATKTYVTNINAIIILKNLANNYGQDHRP